MPNRILKESICVSEQVNALSPFEETLFYRLIVSADDYGRYYGNPAIIRGRLFPLKDIRDKQICDALRTLSSVELVEVYTVDGKPFVRLTGWERHQSIRSKSSKFPAPEQPPDDLQASENICKHMQADENICKQMKANAPVFVFENRESINDKRETKECANAHSARARARFVPPTLEEVKAYCDERKNGIDPNEFIDFYASKGWKVGKNSMTDWQACVRTWEKRRETGAPSGYTRPENPKNHYEQRSYTNDELEEATGMAELLKEAREGGV